MVEPRVVVKIPLAPKVRGADTGKFLQEPTMYTMALPVMEFQDQGYKIRKVFA